MKLVIDMLKDAYPQAEIDERSYKVDRTLVMDIDGCKVGIETQGDPGSRLPTSLKRFVDADCEIIVCACRSYGATRTLVEDLSKNGYVIQWFDKHRSIEFAHQARDNESVARRVLAAIGEALKAREAPAA
ncbi:hypothetical protein [Pseudorhodoferax sp. Leaf265]|uniref:hypothetical protein n=1 Tax=Pseudorhodoferax sp. Leaf265 TaxID=1736315 RepID=UPI0006F5C44C|nr:hypothetical protein [Pseudorhodoferax sp. Leaf265]